MSDLFDDVVAGRAAQPLDPVEPAPTAPAPAPEQTSAEPDLFAPVAQEREQTSAARLSMLGDVMRSMGNPDDKAAALDISRKTGAPADFVLHELPFWKQRLEASGKDPARFARENPELAAIALDNPMIGEIVTGDKPVSALMQALRVAQWAAGRGGAGSIDAASGWEGDKVRAAKQTKMVRTSTTALTGVERQLGKYEQVPSPEEWLDPGTGEVHPAGSMVWRQVAPGIYQDDLSRNFEQVTGGGRLALQYLWQKNAGRDTFDTEAQALDLRNRSVPPDYQGNIWERSLLDATTLLGSQAATWVPMGVAAAVTAPLGPVASTVAAGVVSYGTSFAMEMGSFWDYRDMRDEKGNPVGDEVAGGMAVMYSLLAAGIETGVNLGPWAKLVTGKGAAGLKAEAKAFLKTMAADPAKRALLAESFTRWTKASVGEGLEEGSQNLLQDFFGWFGRGITAGRAEGGTFDAQPFDLAGSVVDAIDVAATTMRGSFIIGAAPAARQHMGARASLQREWERSHVAEARLAAISGAIADSPTAKGAPEAFVRAVEAETEASGGEKVTHAHVDTEGITRLGQEQNLDPAALLEQAIGPEAAERFRAALATGEKMAIPLQEYVEKWHPSGLAEALLPDTTTRGHGVPTPNERVRQEVKDAADIKAIVDVIGTEEDKPTPYESLIEKVTKELVTAGKLKAKDAKPYVAVWRHFIAAESERNEVDRDTLAGQVVLKIAEAAQDVPAIQGLVQGAVNGTDSAEFKAWFGKSAVVDEKGVPRLVTHGTNRTFESFAAGEGRAAWFSEDPSLSSGYAAGRQGAAQLHPVRLAIQNPLRLPWDMNVLATYAEVRDATGVDVRPGKYTDEVADGVEQKFTTHQIVNSPEFIKAAQAAGYDGIAAAEAGAMTWAVFDPGQAKSIFNRGTWDGQDANTLRQEVSPEAKAILDNVAAALADPDTVSPTAEVVLPPGGTRLMQLERELETDPETGKITKAKLKGTGFDDYLAQVRTWMEGQGYKEKEIKEHLSGLLGQLKIFTALGARDLTLLPAGDGGAGKKGPIRKNVDPIYKISFDASAMCVKRLEASATQAYIENQLRKIRPDQPTMTASERVALIAFFKAEGKTAPCLYCYVESPRAKMGEQAGKAIAVILSGKIPEGFKKDARAAAKKAIAQFRALKLKKTDINAALVLRPELARTPSAQKITAVEQKDIYDFIAQQALYAKANQPKLYSEYRAQILGEKQSVIDELNTYAGFRFFSTSDFQAEHVIDLIQAFQDLALRKAKAHAYTKVVDFLKVFGKTGMKIQTSVFAQATARIEETKEGTWRVLEKGTEKELFSQAVEKLPTKGLKGKDLAKAEQKNRLAARKAEEAARAYLNDHIPEGGFVEDVWQGMAWKDAQDASAASPDVGAVFVATSDAQIRWALEQDWIHYVIPFHYSGLESKYYEQLGWSDFTATQSEKKVKGYVRPKGDQFEVLFFGKVKGTFTSKSAANDFRRAEAKKYWAASKAWREEEAAKQGKKLNEVTVEKDEETGEFRPLVNGDPVLDKEGEVRTFDTEEAAKEAGEKAARNGVQKIRMHHLGAHEGLADEQMTAKYLELAEQRGVEPVFAKFSDHPKFAKLKKDYARSDTPFSPVNATESKDGGPGIDFNEAGRVIETVFDKTAPQAKEDRKIGDRLVALIKAGGKDLGVEILKALEAGKDLDPNAPVKIGSKRLAQGSFPVARTLLEQAAFHGTRVRGIGKFSTEYIGTGEGAQVYGWGLYFAEAVAVAEEYRRNLTPQEKSLRFSFDDTKVILAERLSEAGYEANKVGERIAKSWNTAFEFAKAVGAKDVTGTYEGIERLGRTYGIDVSDLLWNPETDGKGQVYKVEIPEKDELLDWDLPFSAQPEKVRAALLRMVEGNPELGRLFYSRSYSAKIAPTLKGEHVYEKLQLHAEKKLEERATDAGQYYDRAADRTAAARMASMFLAEAGLPGLKYLDERSRQKTEGQTSNFVIWSDEAVGVMGTLHQNDQNEQGTLAKEPGPRGWLDTARVGAQRMVSIFLTRKADLSTFLHESGHAFWELKADLAERPDAPEQVKKDFATALAWMGVKDRAELDQRSAEANAIRAQADAEGRLLTAAEKRQILDLVEPFEKWARGFEKYLMEGKAPSLGLAGAFAQFKIWLFELYKQVGALRVDLGPEITGVFDRMLATEKEIKAAARDIGLTGPSVEKAKSRAEIAALKEVARVHEDWWKKELEAETDRAEAEYEALPGRRAWAFLRRGEGSDALKALGDDVKLDYRAVADVVGIDAAERMFRGLLQKYSARTGEAGLSPDHLAAVLGGVESGRALLEQMVKVPAKAEWVAARADDAMKARHPGILEEKERLKALVDEALHNEPSVTEELHKQWAEDTKAAGTPGPSPEAVRAAAKILIRRQRVQQVDPARYARQERAEAIKRALAAKEADEAKAKLDSATAAREKLEAELATPAPAKEGATAADAQDRTKKLEERIAKARETEGKAQEKYQEAAKKKALASQRRLLNHYLAVEAKRVQRAAERTTEIASKMLTEKGQERLGKASPVARNMVLRVLEGTGFVKGIPAEAKNSGMAELLSVFDAQEPVMEQAGMAAKAEVDFDPTLVEDMYRNPVVFDDLTVAQMEELQFFLLNVRSLTRGMTMIRVGNEMVALEALVGDIANEASRLPMQPASYNAATQATWGQSHAWTMVREHEASLRDPLTIWMDDEWLGVSARRALRDRYYEARDTEDRLLEGAGLRIQAAFDEMPKEMKDRRTDVVDRSMLSAENETRRGPVDRLWMMQVLANLGNLGNMQRLLEGRNWTMEQVHEFFRVNKLTAEEAEFVQSLWDLNDKYLWPELSKVYEAVHGTLPAKIEASPLALALADGTTLTLRGGYYPAMGDPLDSKQGKKQEQDSTLNAANYDNFRASLLQGFTRGRIEGAKYVIRLDDFHNYPMHVSRVIRYVAFEEYVRDAGRLIRAIEPTITQRLGPGAMIQLDRWLKVVASGSPDSVSAADRGFKYVVGWLVGRVVLTAMMLKIGNAIADVVTPLIGSLGPKSSRVPFIRHLLPAVLEGTVGLVVPAQAGHGFFAMRKEAREKSPELRGRHGKQLKQMRKVFQRVMTEGKKFRPLAKLGSNVEPGRALDWAHDHGFIMQETAATWGETVLWTAAYRWAKRKTGGDEAESIRRADDVIQKVFPSDRPAEKSHAMRSKNALGAIFTMGGFFNKVGNRALQTVHPAVVEWAEAEGWVEKGKVAAVQLPTVGFMLTGIFGVVQVLGGILEGRGPEDDESIPEYVKRKAASAPLVIHPVLAQGQGLVEAWVADDEIKGKIAFSASERSAPAVGSVLRIMKNTGVIADSDKPDEKRLWAAADVLGLVLGLPSSQIKRTGQAIQSGDPTLTELIYGPDR